MQCSKCRGCLEDFLSTSLEYDMYIYKYYRDKAFKKIIPELTNYIQRLRTIVPEDLIRFAKERADLIPKNIIENSNKFERDIYFPFIYGLIKENLEEFKKETNHIGWFLLDSNCFKLKGVKEPHMLTQLYLCYVVPKGLFLLDNIHGDHTIYRNFTQTTTIPIAKDYIKTTTICVSSESLIEPSMFPSNFTSVVSHDDTSIEGVQEIHIGLHDDIWTIMNST